MHKKSASTPNNFFVLCSKVQTDYLTLRVNQFFVETRRFVRRNNSPRPECLKVQLMRQSQFYLVPSLQVVGHAQ